MMKILTIFAALTLVGMTGAAGDQGDRSLIFYFERGRDSGVIVTGTGAWVYPESVPAT